MSLYFLIMTCCFFTGCGDGSKDKRIEELEAQLLKQAQEAEAAGKAKPPAVSVCDRTKEVQDLILLKVKKTDCKAVTDQELSSITTIVLEEPVTLKVNDFSGFTSLGVIMVNLGELDDSDRVQNTVLPADVFFGLTSLELLVLSGEVEALPSGLLSGLTSLERVVLDFYLDDVPADLFSGLTRLQRIVIKSRNYPAGLFSNLPALKDIDIYYGAAFPEAEKQRIQAEVGEGVRIH